MDGIATLVQARKAQGLTVNVVDVNDLYAKYSYGVFDPQALRTTSVCPQNLGTQYVLLVGGDTYDYRNYLGMNSISFIPSLYIATIHLGQVCSVGSALCGCGRRQGPGSGDWALPGAYGGGIGTDGEEDACLPEEGLWAEWSFHLR